MSNHRYPLHFLLILLILSAVPFYTFTSAIKVNNNWEPVNSPTISGGVISHILPNPSDPNHIFAFQRLQDTSNVFESVNGGTDWSAISSLPHRWIDGVAVDPVNPDILYVAADKSIFRSENTGRDWGKVTDFGEDVVSPASQTLYTLENLGYSEDCPTGKTDFIASRDGGFTWSRQPLGCHIASQIFSIPPYPDWVYIESGESPLELSLLRSMDGGDTWQTIPLTGEWFESGFMDLAIDPSNPERIFTSSGRGIVLSENGGITWKSILEISTLGHFRFSFTDGTLYAGMDPIVYAETPVIYRSEDGGQTWECFPWLVDTRLNDFWADNSHSGWVLAALDGYGIYKSTDGGETWKQSNEGIWTHTIVDDLAVSRNSDSTIYGITNWPRRTLIKTEDAFQTWNEIPTLGDFYKLAVNPNDSENVWTVSSVGLQESTNGGESWQLVSTLSVRDIDVSYGAPDRPCAVGYTDQESYLICKETVNQSQETEWIQYEIPNIKNSSIIHISPSDPNLTIITGSDSEYSNRSLYISKNGGLSWQKVLQGPNDYGILNLMVGSGQPETILAVFFQYHPDNLLIYQSEDHGETWQDITGPLSNAGGEMWTGWTYKAPMTFDSSSNIYFATRGVVLQRMLNKQTWIAVKNNPERIQDMVLLPALPGRILISTEFGLQQRELPIIQYLWMPLIQ